MYNVQMTMTMVLQQYSVFSAPQLAFLFVMVKHPSRQKVLLGWWHDASLRIHKSQHNTHVKVDRENPVRYGDKKIIVDI